MYTVCMCVYVLPSLNHTQMPATTWTQEILDYSPMWGFTERRRIHQKFLIGKEQCMAFGNDELDESQ